MRQRRFHPGAVLLVAVLQVVVTTGASLGLVLCIDADGHREIEAVFAADCCDDARERGGDLARTRCGCTDTPLLGRALPAKPPKASVHAVSTLSDDAEINATCVDDRAPRFGARDRVGPSLLKGSSLRPRRGVVLLL